MSDSSEITRRFNDVMPWGSSTCSKAPALEPEEPATIVRGNGCRVWDDRGREFIDFRNALGPVTLGYRFPAVDEAIRRQLESGIIFGQPHALECEVAEMLKEIIPCAEQVRFLKTGGEAIAACIRLARAATGREHVIQVGYNGWLNSLAAGGRVLPGATACDAPPGVPKALAALHHACPWNDVAAMEALLDAHDVAAVVVASDYANAAAGKTYYPAVRELTHRKGAVLIFDEIVTGFRVALAGVQEYWGVTPDMSVFAKGMANGMPLSAYCGRRDLMQQAKRAVVSTTYGGETLSLAAAKATIETYQREKVVDVLWQQGEKLWPRVNEMLKAHAIPARTQGFAPGPAWMFDDPKYADTFFRACYRHGLSFYYISSMNFSHRDDDITEALRRFERVCGELRG
jgi:glutamate-1-semialdehyde 2,1-aminomutase